MTLPTTLAEWLAHCERLHPKTIDMTLARTKTLIERSALKFAMPVISVAGTNGKGSTCAMLEAMAIAAGYKVGAYIKPHLVHFEERCRHQRRHGEGRRPDPALRGGGGRARRHRADVLRVHDAGHHAHAGDGGGGPRDPRGGPGRPARRGQRGRRRRLGHHQHRHRPRRIPGPRPRVDRAREGAHRARRPAADRRRPDAAAKHHRLRHAGRRRPVAVRARLQLLRRPPAMGLERPRQALELARLSVAARRQPAAQRVGRAGRARDAARASCR